jgi:hypothetical protein
MRRAFVFALFLLFACRESDPIAAKVDAIADAAEDRDVSDVMSHLSANFDGNRGEIEGYLKRYFFAYQSFDVSVLDLRSQVSGDEAWATFRVNMIGVPKTLGGIDQYMPRSASYRFEVSLRDEGGEWKVVSARWEDLAAPGR